jgi:pyrimidine deaminase RibD-like protein
LLIAAFVDTVIMTRSNNFRNMQTSSSRIPMMVAVVLGMLMTLYPNTASSFSSHSALPSTPTRCHSNQQFSPRFSYQLLAEFESGGSSSSSELELEIAEEAEQDSVEADEDEEMEEMTPVEANEKQVDDKENETEEEFVLPPSSTYFWSMEENQESSLSTAEALTLDQEQLLKDESFMRMAIDMAGEERGPNSAYPNPSVGAVLVADDGRILAKGKSSYAKDAIRDVLENAGLTATPLREWCITWPASMKFRNDLAAATLYVTLEPDAERRGQALPPLTQLIELSGISRIVIGAASPIPEQATNGAQALHQAGLDVTMGLVLVDECQSLIQLYTDRVLSKLQCMARKHRQYFNRPLGFLHCSVVDSSDLEAFAQHGNAFGKSFGGQILSERNFGSYEFAPPPEQIWADDEGNDFNELDFLANMEFDEDEEEAMLSLDFEEENPQERLDGVSMMPWYEQVDAVIATFPHAGNNGPTEENDTVMSRLNGLKWLATYGNDLPPGVERILVMDATDLDDLPLSNSDPNLPPGVDVEAFWMAARRRPSRVLLRKGKSTQAEAAAKAAAA